MGFFHKHTGKIPSRAQQLMKSLRGTSTFPWQLPLLDKSLSYFSLTQPKLYPGNLKKEPNWTDNCGKQTAKNLFIWAWWGSHMIEWMIVRTTSKEMFGLSSVQLSLSPLTKMLQDCRVHRQALGKSPSFLTLPPQPLRDRNSTWNARGKAFRLTPQTRRLAVSKKLHTSLF